MQVEPLSNSANAPAAPLPSGSGSGELYRYRFVPPVGCDDDGYPFCDGAALDNYSHVEIMSGGHQALCRHFGGRALVAFNVGVYYSRGDRGACIVPDLFVAFGGAPGLSYKLWEQPKPAFMLEILSRRSWKKDVGIKHRTCEALGIDEYWLIDSADKRLDAPLVGYRLQGGAYRRINENRHNRLPSKALGLELRLADGRLLFHDADSGEPLPSLADEHAAKRAAERRSKAEQAARLAAEKQAAAEQAARRAAEKQAAAEQAARLEVEKHLAQARAQLAALESERP